MKGPGPISAAAPEIVGTPTIGRSDYYATFAGHPDPARQVGWEDLARQAHRFEFVRRLLAPGDVVLDVGAGLGALGRHLMVHGHRGAYLGLERDAVFVARARLLDPPIHLVHRDALAGPAWPEADVVALVGVLVDGAALTSDGERFKRLRLFLERALAAARKAVVLVTLKQEALEADPIRSLEPALGGVRLTELPWLLGERPYAVDDDLSPLDRIVVIPTTRVPLMP